MADYLDFVPFLLPGAVTLLIAAGLSGRKGGDAALSLAEWLVYTAAGALFAGTIPIDAVSSGKNEAVEAVLGFGTWPRFWMCMVFALVLGLVMGFVKALDIHAVIEKKEAERRPDGKGRKGRKVLGILAMAAMVAVVFLPNLGQIRENAAARKYVKTANAVFSGLETRIREELKQNTEPEDIKSFEIEGVPVKRVYADQRWKDGGAKDGYEAAYMLDGHGALVYFTFRDDQRASTWSGPTTDKEFLSSNGAWNNGKGYGWSGYNVKQ